jgi:orotate phosphoribosyltransferase
VVLHILTNYDALLEEAVASGYIKEEDLKVLAEWRFKPDTWGK